MSNKNIKLLLIIFIVIAGFLGLKLYTPRLLPQTSPYTEKTKNINPDAVQTIEVKYQKETVKLRKENNAWMLDNKKADAIKINELFTTLFPKIPPELIAQTDKRYTELELTEDLATQVLFDDKLTLLLGKYTDAGSYARFSNDSNVYEIKKATTITTNHQDWYDKMVISFDKTKATKLSFKETTMTVVLTKKEDKWYSEDNKEAKKDKIESVLSSLSSLYAQSLFSESETTVFPEIPTLILTVEYDGKSEILELYKGTSEYLIKRQSDNERFIVREYAISTIISAPKEIL